ncbi:MAG: ABC transporter permease subunit/CPBP intramembrane protease, partial [Planctomycetaceae bacterium]
SVASLITDAPRIRKLAAEHDRLWKARQAAEEARNAAEVQLLTKQLDPVHDQLGGLLAKSRVEVLVLIPDDFAASIERTDRALAERRIGQAENNERPHPFIVHNGADEKSMIAYQGVRRALESWEKEILNRQLTRAGLPQSLPKPVNAAEIDVAKQEQVAANVWSKMFPALVVIMAVTGAFYPAVDLGAGEKERGTMETLLICPAKRSEIVVGKFLTVMLFSLTTTILNLFSMGFTGRYIASVIGSDGLSKVGDLSAPGPLSIMWVLVLLLPLAALFSALCLALATFARSSKEGQYYLTPLLMVTMGLTVFCLFPTVQIEPFYSVMPIVGPALLLKELLASPGSTEPLVYVIPVLVTSVGYSLLALWWAIDQFAREDVLFREAERFDLRLWVRHLLRDKEPTPSFAEALLCFVMIMLLQFAAMRFMRDALPANIADNVGRPVVQAMLLKLILIQQLVIVGTPALLMGVILTTSVRKTFRLNWPEKQWLLAAVALPIVLHPLTIELGANLQWFFPPLPKSVHDVLAAMSSDDLPFWFVLLVFAAAPALCEELAFRGFMLSGFSQSGRIGVAVGLSSAAFGLMHMIPQQVFNAALLGVVLGMLAVRSNSLLPCILFHFLYNGLEVVRSRFGGTLPRTGPTEFLLWFDGDSLRFRWPTLVLAGAAAFVLLRMLVPSRAKQRDQHRTLDDRPADPDERSPREARTHSALTR